MCHLSVIGVSSVSSACLRHVFDRSSVHQSVVNVSLACHRPVIGLSSACHRPVIGSSSERHHYRPPAHGQVFDQRQWGGAAARVRPELGGRRGRPLQQLAPADGHLRRVTLQPVEHRGMTLVGLHFLVCRTQQRDERLERPVNPRNVTAAICSEWHEARLVLEQSLIVFKCWLKLRSIKRLIMVVTLDHKNLYFFFF